MKIVSVVLLFILVLTACEFLMEDEEILAAMKSGNVEDCFSLSGEHDQQRQDRCVQKVASKTDDASACPRIESDHHRDRCYSDIASNTENMELCMKVSKGDRDDCYETYATKNEDPAACDAVSKERDQWSCFDRLARSTKNADYCDKVREPEQNIECFIDIAISTGNADLCDRWDASRRSPMPCIEEVAAKNNKVEACDKLEGWDRGNCRAYTGLNNGRPELCDDGDAVLSEICYKDTADVHKDPDLCEEKLSTAGDKQDCLWTVARALKDPKVCERIPEGIGRDLCLESATPS